MNRMLATGLGLLALVPLSVRGLAAQEAGAQQAKKVSSQANDPVVSLDFAGGSLAKFAAALREVGDDVNIVLPSLATEVDLPALVLSRASVESALKSIGSIASEDFRVEVATLRSALGKPVYAVSVRPTSNKRTAATTPNTQANDQPTRVDVFSLKFLTSTVPGDIGDGAVTIKPETILTAVDTGLGIGSGASEPVIRYHQDSGLLFIKGTGLEIALVRQILRNMENDVRRLREASKLEAVMQKKQATAGPKANQAR